MSCRFSARFKCNVQYNDGEVQCAGMACDWPQPQPCMVR